MFDNDDHARGGGYDVPGCLASPFLGVDEDNEEVRLRMLANANVWYNNQNAPVQPQLSKYKVINIPDI